MEVEAPRIEITASIANLRPLTKVANWIDAIAAIGEDKGMEVSHGYFEHPPHIELR